jgi:hypothetical protein
MTLQTDELSALRRRFANKHFQLDPRRPDTSSTKIKHSQICVAFATSSPCSNIASIPKWGSSLFPASRLKQDDACHHLITRRNPTQDNAKVAQTLRNEIAAATLLAAAPPRQIACASA